MTYSHRKTKSGFSGELPASLTRISIDQLNLSVRSHNALRTRGVDTVGKLVRLSDDDLLQFEAVGAKSLADIRRAIAEILSPDGVFQRLSKQTTPGLDGSREEGLFAADGRGLTSGGWKVPPHREETLDAPIDVLDFSTRSSKVLANLDVLSLRQLLNYPKQKLFRAANIGRKSIAEIETKIVAYLSRQQDAGARLQGVSPNTEAPHCPMGVKDFVTQMLSLLPDQQRNILADRYGLWDGIAETLQDIGDKLGLTRERIRQIEGQGIKRLRRLFGHGAIRTRMIENVKYFLEYEGTEKCSVIGEDEAISSLAIGCTSEEAGLAIEFLQDIDSPGDSLFARSFIEVEAEAYCLAQKAASEYKQMLTLIEASLQTHQKPMAQATLFNDVASRTGSALAGDQLQLARRILSVSSTVSLLRNGTVAISSWTKVRGRGATRIAEAALRLLGRPAHVNEIVKTAATLVREEAALSKGTIHNTLITKREMFVWVKSGTYGLAAWGLKRPPFIKNRIIELLSESEYPLPFWHLKEKVLEVCNCKDESVRMTLDLDPRLFRKFEGNQYGLRKHYES
jgi:Bacterial RNA polymerase, alpha chain C terminal domain/Sigma-70, region 4